MIKRTLYFGNPLLLRMQQEQLVVEYPETKEQKTIPLEDVGLVIIDHPQVSVTHGLINALTDHNAAVLWCDNRHLPNGLILPMGANHVFTKKLRAQLSASEPLKKQLWKQTIQAKIENQAHVLNYFEKDGEQLYALVSKVSSGDTENIEARASVLYWKLLFEDIGEFTRKRFGPPPNHLLNYGYAILRAVIARSLVASGCLPAWGIFHRNQYNPFCLADDIMEPFRPLVDKHVFSLLTETGEWFGNEINAEQKKHLLGIPVLDIVIDKMKSPLMVGAQRTTASLMKCFEGEIRKISYPEIP